MNRGNNELINEESHFKEIVEIINKQIEEENKTIEELQSNPWDNIKDLGKRVDIIRNRISTLSKCKSNPYFARIDYVLDGKVKTIYIGYQDVINGSETVVVDWRNPIGDLYYDTNQINGSFNGQILLKRQFMIENEQLKAYFDVDLSNNKTLCSSTGHGLKTIVPLIQTEQNDVIRRDIEEDLIIQGGSGSGKTTTLLHRLAYLIYKYNNTINSNKYLVLCPKHSYMNYIKPVISDLDLNSISQLDFGSFLLNYINENINVDLSDNSKTTQSTFSYKKLIDDFLTNYMDDLISKDLKIGKFVVVSKEQIKKIYDSIEEEKLGKKIIILAEKIKCFISRHKSLILSRYIEYSDNLLKHAKNEKEIEKFRKKFKRDRESINNNCTTQICNYIKKYSISIFDLYNQFLMDKSVEEEFDLDELDSMIMRNKNKIYNYYDLITLAYLKYRLKSSDKYNSIKYTVLDEAQDLGEFEFYLLKQLLPNSHFSISGDLTQSTNENYGIDNWNRVNEIMFANTGEIITFNNSYCTLSITSSDDKEKTSIANKREFDDETLIIKHIITSINNFLNKGYKSIAIISKTSEQSKRLNDLLKKCGLDIPNILSNDDVSRINVCTISSDLVSDLEFDGVIINDASELNYSSSNEQDMKLLYVAISRAFYELEIISLGSMNKIVAQTNIQKSKQKIIK